MSPQTRYSRGPPAKFASDFFFFFNFLSASGSDFFFSVERECRLEVGGAQLAPLSLSLDCQAPLPTTAKSHANIGSKIALMELLPSECRGRSQRAIIRGQHRA